MNKEREPYKDRKRKVYRNTEEEKTWKDGDKDRCRKRETFKKGEREQEKGRRESDTKRREKDI